MAGTEIADAARMRLTYKQYSTDAITPGTQPDKATDPAATGGQVLRRVNSTLSLKKAIASASEIRTSRMRYDVRHGGEWVEGKISGELSCKTYQDFFAAVALGSLASGESASNADFTNITAAAAGPTFTVGASSWAAQNFRNGDVVRFTTFTGNQTQNYLLYGLSGTVADAYPAPTDSGPDSSFTVTVPGRKLFPPPSNHVYSKWFFEHYYADTDVALLFKECRIGGWTINVPPDGNATVEFDVMGRAMEQVQGGAAPFFTAPTDPTSTGILNGINGVVLIGGTAVATITGASLYARRPLSRKAVLGTPVSPEIFASGTMDAGGSLTMMLMDGTFLDHFSNEDEVEIALMLTASESAQADFMSFYFPRCKFTGADINNQGEADVPITLPFVALEKPSTTGYDNTMFTMIDSLSA